MPSTNAEGTPIADDGSRLGKWEAWIRQACGGRGKHALFVAAILALTVISRAVLVSRGGQNFFYDEAKFSTATEAARIMAKGHFRDALVYAIQPHEAVYADHVGYKLFGILPELLDNRVGADPRIPAYFFSAFSALNVLILAGIAYRLSGSRRAFDLTLLAAATSATLLIYTRFIVPYDISLCFALLGLWIGAKRPAGYLRSALVGALSSWAFFCYYGHWQLAGVVMALHVLWLTDGPFSFIKRALATAIGFLAVVGAMLGLSHYGTHTLFHDMMEITKAQAAGANDFRSTLNSWLYFFYAEKGALFLRVFAFIGALCLEFSGARPPERRMLTPLRLMALGFGALYLTFFVDSDLRHHLVVHGRHSRQLVPFLIVGFGIGCDRLSARFRRGTLLAAGAAALLLLNAAATFREPFVMAFPRDFDTKAEALLKDLPPLTDGKSYYRKVNVDHFTYEPEVLRDPPLETLLASPHPLQYLPYIYEGESQALKARRVAIDHRMRLVRMAVPEAEQVKGEPYGIVELTVVFPSDRAGFTEPLLSVGPRHHGDLFYIYYLTEEKAQLEFLNMGFAGVASAPFSYEPGKPRVLRLFSGSLMPPEGAPMAGVNSGEAALLRHRVYAAIDGTVILDKPSTPNAALPGEVFAGVNAVEAGAAGAQFWGTIRSATRGGLPPLPKGIGNDQNFGPVHLEVAAPPTSNGTAEPLLAVGVPGRAVLGFMRIRPDGSVIFGVEIWGVGSFESQPLPHPPGPSLEANYSFGSLYPRVGDPAWGTVSEARQREIANRITITVNGKVALDLEHDTPDLTSLPVAIGSNPVGGSLVNAGFSGRILFSYRAPIGK